MPEDDIAEVLHRLTALRSRLSAEEHAELRETLTSWITRLETAPEQRTPLGSFRDGVPPDLEDVHPGKIGPILCAVGDLLKATADALPPPGKVGRAGDG
ncbi:hypothetical protein [Actinoplanes couchii]|uniref:Uncharacterized protein n=1 Tax=Actinoplanes couchii TaxID=403638 RepID=A0ABQ3XLL4_9ACTN|nr:hypothetical protein [Actinoplanes couchii]MDR6319391.1 restriction endonuclease S subunit [Actinoplanes couchii]GID59398.1 hypothetical protein Aco03nite_078020 [Actinoplanes couchii]